MDGIGDAVTVRHSPAGYRAWLDFHYLELSTLHNTTAQIGSRKKQLPERFHFAIDNRGEEGLETRAYAVTESMSRSHDRYDSMVSGLVRAAVSCIILYW